MRRRATKPPAPELGRDPYGDLYVRTGLGWIRVADLSDRQRAELRIPKEAR